MIVLIGRVTIRRRRYVSDRKTVACLAVFATLLLPTSGHSQEVAHTADAVIAANVAARGGLLRLDSVRTQELRGHISFSSGLVHPFAVDLARPGKIRTEITLDGGRIVQAYDGSTGWTIDPVQVQNDTTPHLLAAGEAQNVAAGGDMDGPLIHYAEKGNHVTFAGIDTADGRPAYQLDVVTAAGLHDVYYIDKVSHLQTKWRGKRVMNGAPVVFESFFRDYRSVNGVMFAFKVDSGTEGQPGGQHIVLATIKLNESLPDAEFSMPSPTGR
jgi:outer membrane lipoprotein-sorting protein